MVELHNAFVVQPDSNMVLPEVELDPKQRPFSGCIGALDGTHIAAHIPTEHQKRFWNRKSKISQSVLAAVHFDGTFTYVVAGGEGRIHDASLCRMA